MKKHIVWILLVGITFTGLSQNTPAYQDTIPFRNDLGLIIIPITFNGVEKQFAFDTGAQLTLAYGWAEEEGLKRTRKTLTINSSSGLKSKMRYYKSGAINLASRKINNHRILNAPRNDIFSCHTIDGILGVDIIKAFNWTIDYANKILVMTPASYVPDKLEDMHELDFEFSNNRPSVFLNHKDTTFKFLLDTGAGGTSNISKHNYTLTTIDDYEQVQFQTGSFDVNGILTTSKPIVFQFPETTSKDVSLSPIIYYNNKKSTKIGNSLWREKQLFLSLKNDQLYLSVPEIKQNNKVYPCSLIFQDGAMRVVRIEEGSDIWNAGIRQGDTVSLFNGQAYEDFCSLDKAQRNLVKNSGTMELTFANGKEFTVTRKQLF